MIKNVKNLGSFEDENGHITASILKKSDEASEK